jgi:hypothetical protein
LIFASHDSSPPPSYRSLATGRTHQIRGQLKAMGFSLVGDIQYGGAEVLQEAGTSKSSSFDPLALQCCQLEFLDPDVITDEEGEVVKLKRSERWNSFSLNNTWWTPHLDEYNLYNRSLNSITRPEEATTDGAADFGLAAEVAKASAQNFPSWWGNAGKPPRPDLLPDRVQLSPGKNKYVLVRATHPMEPHVTHWFVKSASPTECGGPYHGHVAQDLREWIEAAGYEAEVTGGGRIDYAPDEERCVVYGFSYGFGKGNHNQAARIIRDDSFGTIPATFDYTDGLY